MKTINEHWHKFANQVIPANAGYDQRREMKRSFFSGFTVALGILTNDLADLPEDEACKELASLIKQCEGFYEAVKLDKA